MLAQPTRRTLRSTSIFAILTCLLATAPVWSSNFDHAHPVWNQLVQRHVIDSADHHSSRVDYAGMGHDRAALREYLHALEAVSAEDYAGFARDRQLAFLINAYNAFTVELILRHYPKLDSIRDIGGLFGNPWKIRFFRLLGRDRHLDDVEHGLIRARGVFDEPMIHFAVNCAAADCPPLRSEAYVADRLAEQLRDQTRRFLGNRGINRFDVDAGRLWVTPLLDWYGVDFGGSKGVRAWLSERAEWLDLPAPQIRSVANGTVKIAFTDYDWALNDIHTAQERALFSPSANDHATP